MIIVIVAVVVVGSLVPVVWVGQVGRDTYQLIPAYLID